MKTEIVEWLGQSDLLLPQLIAEGLAANDRVKARLSVLQAAARHAQDPRGTRIDLAEECRAAGLDPIPLQALANSATLAEEAKVTAPGLGTLGKAIWDDTAAMLRAVQAGDPTKAETYVSRRDAIKAASQLGADAVTRAEIVGLTAISEADSLHRLIMDLHRALNALAATHAQEMVAGAQCYGLTAEDKQALEAFMQGVDSTRALKFDHPGLGTTALRAGTRFTIQNDIGETDAHVVVVGIEPAAVTITYTDAHHARAKFFTRLFRDFSVQWSGLDDKTSAALKDQEAFYLITGRYPYADAEARDSFLREIGASLVFQIDWNKARKVLRAFVGNADAVRLLEWAVARRIGHRGFLQLGGAELINAAVRHAAPARIGFGEHFDQALGREAAVDFLKAVLRISVDALRQGSSLRSAKARIEEALVTHLQRGDTGLLAVIIRQAGLARDIAVAIAQFIDDRRRKLPTDAEALVRHAGRIEEKADRIVFDARGEIARFGIDRGLERLADLIEHTIDELEEAAFIASLAPPDTAPELLESLAELTAVTVSGTEAAVIGAAAAAEIPEGQRVDYEDALAAATRLVEDEHKGDAGERAITTKILGGSYDLKASLAILSLAHPLERATDQLARFGHSLRDYVLSDLSS